MKGAWDSIHVLEVEDNKKNANYRLTSTVMLSLSTKSESLGEVCLAGSLTRQQSETCPLNSRNTHLGNIGKLVEATENRLRLQVTDIYFAKTKEVLSTVRSFMGMPDQEKQKLLTMDLAAALARKGKAM